MHHLMRPARGDSVVPAADCAAEALLAPWKVIKSVFSMRRGAYRNCGVFSTQWDRMDSSCRGGHNFAGSTPGTGFPTISKDTHTFNLFLNQYMVARTTNFTSSMLHYNAKLLLYNYSCMLAKFLMPARNILACSPAMHPLYKTCVSSHTDVERVKVGVGGSHLLGQLGRERGHLDQRITGVGQLLTETGVERVTETQSFTWVDLQQIQWDFYMCWGIMKVCKQLPHTQIICT